MMWIYSTQLRLKVKRHNCRQGRDKRQRRTHYQSRKGHFCGPFVVCLRTLSARDGGGHHRFSVCNPIRCCNISCQLALANKPEIIRIVLLITQTNLHLMSCLNNIRVSPTQCLKSQNLESLKKKISEVSMV